MQPIVSLLSGLVLKSTGSWYVVAGDDGAEYRCRIKGRLRTLGIDTTNPVAAGDRVVFEIAGNSNEGMIAEIKERRNYIIRKSVNLSHQAHIIASNIDIALVVATPVFPRTSTGFIDRFLATAEAYNIPAGIIFNKSDLYDEKVKLYVDELASMYRKIGYRTFIVSALKNDSLNELKKVLHDKVTLFSGHSGTGKSTLVNNLIPGLTLKTTEISAQHLKGKHTTTFAEMHPIPGGGYIIDTPGIREFGILDFEKHQVSHYFPEIFETASACRFNNCLHVNESDCAVLTALEQGKIALSRYESYLSILNNEDVFK
ncbi:MAG TPA: ribosome small subunit-dependent GTPase A [Bacteroidia bacterium]|nr:ribosome small subunit-dependent GTPase A [Bacteroidia bacterium]